MYNGKAYIRGIVESLNTINCKKEIIIVDDGSPDGSYEYCCNEFSGNSAVKVFSKKNGGISDTRNYGLSKASAEYIMFADQDDRVDGNVVSQAYEICSKKNLDGAFWSCDYYKAGVTSHCDIIKQNKIINKQEIQNELLKALIFRESCNLMSFIGHVWAGIYRKGIVDKGIRFRHFVDYEDDQLFVFDFLSQACSILLISDVGYYWNVNPKSYSHAYRQLPDIISSYESYFEYLGKKTKSIFSSDVMREFDDFGCQFTLCDAIRNSGISNIYRQKCVNELKHAIEKPKYKKAIRNPHSHILEKRFTLYLFLLKHGLLGVCIIGTRIFFISKKLGIGRKREV